MLIKRAYSEEQFRDMIAQTPFGIAVFQEDGIGLQVWLTK